MGRELLSSQLREFEVIGAELEHDEALKRREGGNLTYGYADAIKSAFGLFLFQHMSMLNYQNSLAQGKQRQNAETILRVSAIPCGNQITRLIDRIPPATFAPAFSSRLSIAKERGVLDTYKVLDGGVLVVLDGTQYFSSRKIHCDHCLHVTSKQGKRTYYHSMVAAALVKPGGKVVLPLMPEMIRNEDGQEKQDCERKASKRLLKAHGAMLKELHATVLGDDLYADYYTCSAVLEQGLSFIFTCKDDSHPWLSETVAHSYLDTKQRRVWNGRNHLVYTWSWINGVAIRDHKETVLVNYFGLEIYNEEQNKTTYRNTWVTNKPVTAEHVELLADCGRTRWKIENEHNNTLKNQGYHLTHNFGHGERYAGDTYCVLLLLAFLHHGLMQLCDELYIRARACFGRRDEFFNALRFAFIRFEHSSWEDFLHFIHPGAPGG
jgi:hypothetical protein